MGANKGHLYWIIAIALLLSSATIYAQMAPQDCVLGACLDAQSFCYSDVHDSYVDSSSICAGAYYFCINAIAECMDSIPDCDVDFEHCNEICGGPTDKCIAIQNQCISDANNNYDASYQNCGVQQAQCCTSQGYGFEYTSASGDVWYQMFDYDQRVQATLGLANKLHQIAARG